MNGDGFTVVYLISNLFCTVDILMFYNTFLGKPKKPWKLVYFLLFYISISAEYLVVGIPIITLIANLVGLLLLTFLYNGSIKTRCICVIFCYALYMFAEAIIMGLTGYLVVSFIDRTEYRSYVGMGCLPMVFFVIVMLTRIFKSGRKGDEAVPITHWTVIFLIPLSSTVVTVIIHTISGIKLWQIILIESVMFLVTIGVYYLYVKQREFFKKERDHVVAERQLEAYKNQLETIREVENQTISLRHDMKNHLLAIREYANDSKDIKVIEYVDTMSESIPSVKIISTGNKTMDAIVNSKLYEAKKRKILVETNISVDEIGLSDYEITVILGNILDNILQNAKDSASLTVRCNRGRLIIKGKNKCNLVRKMDKFSNIEELSIDSYGTGLKNILSIVENHGGEMHTRYEEDNYLIELILYV